jgi:hypothetical protein
MAHTSSATRLEAKSFDSPDEVRPFRGKGHVDVVDVGGHLVSRNVYDPGWTWAENVKPIAQTDSCEVFHLGYCVAGHMRVVMDDGSEVVIGPGEAAAVPPGHNAEVVGDEQYIWLDFGEIAGFAKH